MYCGTIQTVPSHLKRSNGDKPATAKPQPAKALVQQPLHIAPDHESLDDSAAPSSGLAGSGLISGRLRAQTIAPSTRTPPKLVLLFGICGAGAILLIVLILWFIAS